MEEVAEYASKGGDIDIEELRNKHVEIANRTGSVIVRGIRFNAQNIESLYMAIKDEALATGA